MKETPTFKLLLNFLRSHLPVDSLADLAGITANFITISNVWNENEDYLDLWDLLHFTTQDELAARLRELLFDDLAELDGFEL